MRNVLLVEDSDEDAFFIEQSLPGYEVRQARNRAEMCAALREAVDVILLDFFLPDLTCHDALELIQANQPSCPVIIVSGTIDDGRAVAEVFMRGARSYVLKSNLTRLALEIERVIREQKTERELEQKFKELEQKSKEIATLQKMQNLGVMASGIAHDMNNILTPSLLAVDLLKRQLDPEGLRILAAVKSSIERGAAMVKQMLVFAKCTNGGTDQKLINPGEVVRDIIRYLRTFPPAIELHERIADPLPMVRANATQLYQILLNLCINARQAMNDVGRLEMTVREINLQAYKPVTATEPVTGFFIDIAIRDDGPGIRPEMMENIFKPFYTTKPKGTGLGLSIAQTNAALNHGFIDVHSMVGAGTTFSLLLPVAEEARAQVAAPPIDGHDAAMLLVDDEVLVLEMLRPHLEEAGFQVQVAHNGAEALSVLRKSPVKILVTDLSMPLMSGAELIRQTRAQYPAVKIVCITGLGSAHDPGDVPADATLAKPFSIESLFAVLKNL